VLCSASKQSTARHTRDEPNFHQKSKPATFGSEEKVNANNAKRNNRMKFFNLPLRLSFRTRQLSDHHQQQQCQQATRNLIIWIVVVACFLLLATAENGNVYNNYICCCC